MLSTVCFILLTELFISIISTFFSESQFPC
jgi:hypothetical protein